MENEGESVRSDAGRALRWVVWIILWLWVAFYIFYSVAFEIAEMGELGWAPLLFSLPLLVAMLFMLYLVWRDEYSGGVLLIVFAITMFFFKVPNDAFFVLALKVPPLVGGILLVFLAKRLPRSP